MTIETPVWLQAGVYPARLDRGLIAAIFGEGLLTGFAVSQRGAGANMSVDVASGKAVIQGDDESNQGNYYVASTAVENVVVSAAPGTNSRYDIVVLQINDPNAGGAAGDNMQIQVIAGTAAASPVVPDTPDSALLLATIGPITTSTTSITNAMITNVAATARLAFEVVNSAAIDDGAVTTAKIADSNVTGPKIAGGAISEGHIAGGSVATGKIADNAVTNAKMADDSVGSFEIQNEAVIYDKLGNGAVGEAKILGSAVTTGKIADGAVTDAKAGAPTSATLTNGSTSVLYYRFGDMVFVSGTVVAGSDVTLPAGFRPASTVTRMGSFSKASDINIDTPSISINLSGVVSRSGGPAGGSTFEAHFLAA